MPAGNPKDPEKKKDPVTNAVNKTTKKKVKKTKK